ncbi:MBL fold metallo-hydrolase [Luteimicrobium subarcticum]|uniref:Glyoxylase-like metal-dependent hydrolase (Beta-lactamase superfamily II) n=1 Tax=Luteimicrobium subarcticum TaxID=620910 RepID=A0A2M8W3Y7_9MICO|nr:MBL fold metallo-hydrolase [Luteimicrobium subarcticum]PJI85641.1 glyoxylase-like metal-dependent hydrolase (beta-lactamase superfamily II) [Luteimicrobium subarcticum]
MDDGDAVAQNDDGVQGGAPVRVHGVVSPVFGATCYVVAARGARGAATVVVDPGVGVAERVLELVDADGLDVRAVLVTHGHPDHTWDAGTLCAALDVPLVVHADDEAAAVAPPAALTGAGPGSAAAAVGGAFAAAFAASGAGPAVPVSRTVVLDGPVTLRYDDLVVEVLPAPGHTPGSVLLRVGDVVLTGDVLFAGTVGRTDLPGGDGDRMTATLRDVVRGLDPRWTVLPGHGPETTVARELAANPFLRP